MDNQLRNELHKREEFLTKIISDKQKDLKKAPVGKLRISQVGKHTNYYHRTNPKDTEGKYIKAADISSAAALAQKES